MELNPVIAHYHIASMDMYAITAFGTDGTREYPTDDKIRAYMLLTGFQQFDPFLLEIDRVERDLLEGINGEYRQIENEETTNNQRVQKGLAAISGVSGVGFLVGLYNPPVGMVATYGAAGLGGLYSAAFLNTAGDPYHNHEKNIGTSSMDPKRVERLQGKVLQLENNINRIGVDSNIAVRQQRQAQNYFNGVVSAFEENR